MLKEIAAQSYKLSQQQSRLCDLAGTSSGASYGAVALALLAGPLDRGRLNGALARVTARHEILRTSFPVPPGLTHPLQRVHETGGVRLLEHDLSAFGLSPWQAADLLAAAPGGGVPAAGEVGGPAAPGLDADLAALSPGQHLLRLRLPALCADGAALRNLMGEIADSYAEPERQAGPPLQYVDLSVWQDELLTADGAAAGRAYWARPELAPAAAAAGRTAVRGRPEPRIQRATAAGEWARTARAAAALGATVEAFLFAAWQVLLWRSGGAREEVLVGIGCDGRAYPELAAALGLLGRYLPVPATLGAGGRFCDLLAPLAVRLGRHREWQEFFSREALPVPPPSCAYLFDCAPQAPPRSAGDLTLSLLDGDAAFERCEVRLRCLERGADLALELHYDPSACEGSRARRLGEQFQVLLAALVERPETDVAVVKVLLAGERQALLHEWNDTAASLPASPTLHGPFQEQARNAPWRVAVVAAGERLTYGELAARSARLAGYLRRQGVGPGTRVGVCLERSPRLVVALLAVLAAGGAYVPLDPDYPGARRRAILAAAAAQLLLTEERFAGALEGHGARQVLLDALPDLPDVADRGRLAAPEDLAYVLFTSGSTGEPKGVMVSHRAIANRLLWMQRAYPLTAGDTLLQKTQFSFDASIWEVFLPLWHGARLVLAEPGGHQDSAYLARLVAEQEVTVLQLVPTMLRIFLEEPAIAGCGSLRRVFCGGEALSAESCARFHQRLDAELCNLYGPTEAAIDATSWRCAPGAGSGPVPIGRPIDNVRVRLLAPGLEPVGIGTPGELYIAGDGLALGYLGRPDLTAGSFLPDPWSDQPGSRLYRSGDLARHRGGGEIEYLARADQQVKLRGFRIELGEIEAALARLPAVVRVAVVVREDAPGERRLVAYLTVADAAAPTALELRSHLREGLPDFMVPSAFVVLPELPRLPSGKLDRRSLPAPESGRAAGGSPYAAPGTPAELALAEIWAQVLGVDRVGIDDNFFELGGDSILSLQIVSRAAQAGLRLQPRLVFEHQTIGALAAAATAARPSAVPAPPAAIGAVPLTPIQRDFFARVDFDPQHFNQTVLLEIDTLPAAARLGTLLARLLAHHDALRLRFTHGPEGWRQANSAAGGPVPLTYLDLSALAAARQGGEIEAAAAQAQTSLELRDGPILRAVAFDLGGGRPGRVLLAVHHLAIDGVSWRVLLEDLQSGLVQLGRGEEIQLPARTASFQQWAVAGAELAGSGVLAAELDYWLDPRRRHATRLPVDDEAGLAANTESTAETVTASLDAASTAELLQRVPEAYRTQIGDVLLTALAQAFARATGARSLLVDLEGHGREAVLGDLDLTRTVGWFTSVFPVLLELPPEGDAGAALKAVKERLRQLPNRGVGYGLLRYAGAGAGTAAALAALPQAEVSFNYLGRFEQLLAASPGVRLAAESAGPAHGPRQRRRYLLDVNAFTADGRLTVSWEFSRRVHRRATIERLQAFFFDSLRQLIHHCLDPEAGGYTPSDFPLARLSQRELDRLAGGRRTIEDLYPLSPLQRGLLFHALRDRRSGAYFQQVSCILSGELDPQRFASAWRRVVARHSILRTAFVWEDLGEPLQVVYREADLRWTTEDWRAQAPAAQMAGLERYLELERASGFDLALPPLMRVSLLRLGEERHALVWSSHHLVLDGWSAPLVAAEFAAVYRALAAGAEPALARPVPYRGYIEWLGRQDLARAEAFWRRALRGFARPTRVRLEPAAVPGTEEGAGERPAHGELTQEIPAQTVGGLQRLAERHRVTLHTLVQGVWALILGQLSGSVDVLFGAVVSGRPPDLPGSAGMVGMFINTLPVRVRLPMSSPFLPWLETLQAEQAEARQFEYSPLSEVSGWSEVARGVALFDTTFSFNNYPVAEAFGTAPGGLAVEGVRWSERSSFPLDLTVGVGAELALRVMYDARRFAAAAIRSLLQSIDSLLRALLERPQATLADLAQLFRQAPRGEKAMDQVPAFNRFKSVQPKALTLAPQELVTRGALVPGTRLPLLVQPAAGEIDVAEWAASERQTLEQQLAHHGAILFRGFHLDTPETFERFARSVCSELFEDNGEHPRASVSGSIYTPVFYPPEEQLLWHNENSFNQSWPLKILFGCARPAARGGETPVVDSREVFARLPAAIRDRFAERGVTYIRNYGGGPGLDWQTVFQTRERARVEELCRESATELEWQSGDRLRTRATRPAVIRHPASGEMSWFNQAQHWHPSCLDRLTRESIRSLFAAADLPRDCCFGDGSPIADADMAAILEVYRGLEVTFSWQQGDVLLVDNVLTAHGRNAFTGERKLMVALGELTSFSAVA